MSLTADLRIIASGHVVQLHTLEQNRPYPSHIEKSIPGSEL